MPLEVIQTRASTPLAAARGVRFKSGLMPVHQARACPHKNSSPVQARTTKFRKEMEKTLVKIPINLGVDWLWPSRSNLPHFELVHTIIHHLSKVRIVKFGPKCILALLRPLSILGWIDFDLQFRFQFWNLSCYQTYLHCFFYINNPIRPSLVDIYLVRP